VAVQHRDHRNARLSDHAVSSGQNPPELLPLLAVSLTRTDTRYGAAGVSEKLASTFEGNLVMRLTEQLWRNAQPVL
jgi:hypothetical protein